MDKATTRSDPPAHHEEEDDSEDEVDEAYERTPFIATGKHSDYGTRTYR